MSLLVLVGLPLAPAGAASAAPRARPAAAALVRALPRQPGARPRNVVFVLSDDHRWDALSFLGHPWLRTPAMDAMARDGVHVRNAFVTTSLCSPSRASILTGLYAHRHGVVDNNHPLRPDLVFFPQYLQRAGYQAGFFGKWHMGGDDDAPRPGFHRWVSFRGQGEYLPGPDGLNVDGVRTPQRGYITDELTDYALAWLKERDRKRPFFLYLSHKGVHADFIPAERHRGLYAGKSIVLPPTFALTPENLLGRPRWVQDQRNSWHGVDYPYHSRLDLQEYYRRYAETLASVDESLGRLLEGLRREGLLDSTLVIYMGDNGFAFGEHGLIDKRTAYEASMRVPMLVRCPDLFRGGRALDSMIANLDIAPTVLEAAGLHPPRGLDGRSFLPLLRAGDDPDAGPAIPWRQELLYEYFWERNFPHTPTLHALRTERWKYIRAQGVWDIDELYDLQADPHEQRNLIHAPEQAERVRAMNRRLFELLAETDGLALPLRPDRGRQRMQRRRDGAPPGAFPAPLIDDAPAGN